MGCRRRGHRLSGHGRHPIQWNSVDFQPGRVESLDRWRDDAIRRRNQLAASCPAIWRNVPVPKKQRHTLVRGHEPFGLEPVADQLAERAEQPAATNWDELRLAGYF